MKNGKRFLSLLLTIMLLLSAMSVSAMAEATQPLPEDSTTAEETSEEADSLSEEEEPEADKPSEEVPSEESAEKTEETDPVSKDNAQEAEPETEEPAAEEELPEEAESADDEVAGGTVKVTFNCNCSGAYIDVFSDYDWFIPNEYDPFVYYLEPGEYYYSAYCDGFVTIKSYAFKVEEDVAEQTVCVELTGLGDAFSVLYCDAALEGNDFEEDYLNAGNGGGMLLMASFEPEPYSTTAEAAEYLRDTAINSDLGYLMTKLTSRGTKVAEKTNNGAIKLSFKTKNDQENWNKDFTAIFNAAFAHSLTNPTGGDYYVRGRTIGMSGGYESVSWDGTYYTYDFKFVPYLTTTVDQEAQATTAEAALVNELDLKNKDKSDYEKLKTIYTYITDNITYDTSPNSGGEYLADVHSAYAGFVKKSCVCQGYANMVYRLCLEAGIDCRSVGIDSGHEWNIVKLEGNWYFLDSTWDAGKTSWSYFLKGYNFWKTGHGQYYPGNLPSPITGTISGSSGNAISFSYTSSGSVYSFSATPAHAITYVLNGGVNSTDNPCAYAEGTTVTLASPSKEGYTFKGWFTDSEFTTPITEISGSTEDVTLYAAWGAPVEVTFNPCGGELVNPEEAQRVVKYGDKLESLPSVKREGYTIAGWFTEQDGGTEVTAATEVISDMSVTYYAHWTVVKYKITYKLDGGALPTGKVNPAEYTVETRDSITLEAPVKSGCIFRGWYSDSSFINKVETLAGFTGNIVLYARFTGDEYFISADYNGGTIVKGSAVPESYYYRQKNNIILPTLAKTGYTFKGWYNIDTGKRISYISRTAKSDYNLQARFSPVTYKVYCNLNGGKYYTGAKNPGSYNVESADIVLNAPYKTGYTFTGWFKADGTQVETIPAGSTGKLVLYAKYTENSYTIKYDLNGGSGTITAPITTLYSKQIRLLKTGDIYRYGYKFSGWNIKSDGTGKTYGNGAYVRRLSAENGTVTLYAKWTPIKYSIRYSYANGKMPKGSVNPSSYTVESSITLKNPVRSGYTFLGWYDNYGNKTETIGPGMTGTIRLTARWQKN